MSSKKTGGHLQEARGIMTDPQCDVNLTIELDPATAILVLEEVEGARKWRERRVGSLRTIRRSLPPIDAEMRLTAEAEQLAAVAKRIRDALFGERLPEPPPERDPGVHRLRVVSKERPESDWAPGETTEMYGR
jgi:hypothetical protein